MYKKQIGLSGLLICCLYQISTFAQVTTIDYSASGLSTSLCNVFNVSTAQVIGGKTHYPVSGGVSFNGSSIVMQTKLGYTSSTNYATAFAIAYNFQSGNTYTIQVTASMNSADPVSIPHIDAALLSSLPNPNNTSPTSCGYVDQTKWSVLQSSIVGNGAPIQNPSTVTVANFTATSASSYLAILASQGSTSKLTDVLISKIVITQTIPSPAFTLAPTSVGVQCGSTITQTYTVTNVNSTPGITGYTWDLGSSTNGWLYNGSAAAQTITTTSNTITLTSSSCTGVLSNVRATANTSSSSYNTNLSTSSITQPSLSIGGSGNICSSETYSIASLPCNSNVTWSVDPTGVVSLSSTTGSNVTLTAVNHYTSGFQSVVLSASVSNSCGPTHILQTGLGVGNLGSANPPIYGPTQAGCGELVTFYLDPIYTGFQCDWLYPSDWGYYSGQGSNYFTIYVYSTGTVNVVVHDFCGTNSANLNVEVGNCYYYMLSPNPTISNVKIKAKEKKTTNKDVHTNITEINIYDQQGNLKRHQKYNKTVEANVDVSGLNGGVYFIEIVDGVFKERQKLSISKQ